MQDAENVITSSYELRHNSDTNLVCEVGGDGQKLTAIGIQTVT